MGQAFRRATGRIPPAARKPTSTVDRKPPVPPNEDMKVARKVEFDSGDQSDGNQQVNADNVLETRDPKYDAMLNQMLGRVTAKPGGKLEMGEAFVVEKYNRPMPKLRNTKPESGSYEERSVPPGTLNVAQLRHIMLLYQGKADDHHGPMDINQIAEKFRLEVTQVKTILQSLSLPPEDDTKQKRNNQ